MPIRRPNSTYREHEYLTEEQVETLINAARHRGRHGARDALMIRMAYVHGLRVSELINLRWTQVSLEENRLYVTRLKNGNPARHYLTPGEVDALQLMRPTNPGRGPIFISERGRSLTAAAFAKMLTRAAASVNFAIQVHPHMLRHACGYKLANDGCDARLIQDYLGHQNIQHTVRYTRVNQERFRGLFS